ncbi:mechanosensitive ion channel [Sphingomonas piscis]|uniref:Small-conductance mechanosensitive channel n=1 Tax=Sphingomonas piscis TaxID=2714943 RepID=A0A6G7YR28_9SPHN|nr:mechanosensitive ion channel [Sphingomonas piscis]QIK79191.1 mechanosensitive ion channel [Sphingomonas piscis]
MYDDTQRVYWQSQVMEWGPRVLIAALILVATWLVARAVKWGLQKTISRTPALQKHTPGNQHETVGHQIGTVAKLIVWLVGIMAALQFLGIGQILQPINALTMDIFNFLPRLIGAGLIFFIGLIVARIVRQLVQTLLAAANVDGLLARAGIGSTEGTVRTDPAAVPPGTTPGATRTSLARAAGILVFALIIIPVAIAALQVLGIEAISGPAINMLNQVLGAIPRILSAALWIGIAFILAKFVKSIIEAILPPTGFDQAIRSTGIVPASTTPSRVVANIALVAIVLIASIEAAKQLGGGTVAIFLAQVTELGGKVIFGTLIIVVGIFLARVISGLVGSGTGEGGYAQTMVKYAIIALFTAIGLTFMGLADAIVQMAFGLILGSAAVATALAFGLGGRDAAARVLERYVDDTPPPAPPAPPKRIPPAPRPTADDSQPPLV